MNFPPSKQRSAFFQIFELICGAALASHWWSSSCLLFHGNLSLFGPHVGPLLVFYPGNQFYNWSQIEGNWEESSVVENLWSIFDLSGSSSCSLEFSFLFILLCFFKSWCFNCDWWIRIQSLLREVTFDEFQLFSEMNWALSGCRQRNTNDWS